MLAALVTTLTLTMSATPPPQLEWHAWATVKATGERIDLLADRRTADLAHPLDTLELGPEMVIEVVIPARQQVPEVELVITAKGNPLGPQTKRLRPDAENRSSQTLRWYRPVSDDMVISLSCPRDACRERTSRPAVTHHVEVDRRRPVVKRCGQDGLPPDAVPIFPSPRKPAPVTPKPAP